MSKRTFIVTLIVWALAMAAVNVAVFHLLATPTPRTLNE